MANNMSSHTAIMNIATLHKLIIYTTVNACVYSKCAVVSDLYEFITASQLYPLYVSTIAQAVFSVRLSFKKKVKGQQ